MIALIQRVSASSVRVEGKETSRIARGLNVLLGVVKDDSEEDISRLVPKVVNLRIFSDEAGRMGRSVVDVGGEALVISQFTLAGSVKKGRRPSFDDAMRADEAKRLYELFCSRLAEHIPVSRGVFGAMMDVEIHNDGPVTFIIDTKEL